MPSDLVVGIVVLELRLSGCRSLKDKRHAIRGPIDKARQLYRVGIAEVGDQDLWGNAEVCVAVPSSSHDHAQSVLTKVVHLFEDQSGIDVVGVLRDQWRAE